MLNVDIERLICAVFAQNEAYSEYRRAAVAVHYGPIEEITARKKHLEYAFSVSERENSTIYTIMEIFNLDKEAQGRLYIAARAVNRWQISTNYARSLPDSMKKQIETFIFGAPVAPNSFCGRCGCWKD